jgi:outer membrane receptor for ferrienterochelin and colicin
MMKPAIVMVVICCSLAACASIDNTAAKPQLRDDNEYVTGSNIPRRNTSMPSEVRTISAEELQRSELKAPQPMPGGR